MPMLDESEFAEVADLHRQGIQATKEFRQRWGYSTAARYAGSAARAHAAQIPATHGIRRAKTECHSSPPHLPLRATLR